MQEDIEEQRGREEGERILRSIAETMRREGRDLERQENTVFEDSEDEGIGRTNQEEQIPQIPQEIPQGAQEDEEPLTLEEITRIYDESPLSELIARREIKGCFDCNRISYVRNGEVPSWFTSKDVKSWDATIKSTMKEGQEPGHKRSTEKNYIGQLKEMKA